MNGQVTARTVHTSLEVSDWDKWHASCMAHGVRHDSCVIWWVVWPYLDPCNSTHVPTHFLNAGFIHVFAGWCNSKHVHRITRAGRFAAHKSMRDHDA